MEGLVSIVVPVYKVEKYLDRCIYSIVNQTYTNIEIILVDDGSPDACPIICDEWGKRDLRIKVIHKKNAGLGMARNTGIEEAHGEYICFIDSDDYISENTVQLAYEKATKAKADVVLYGMVRIGKNNTIIGGMIPQTDKDVFAGKEVCGELLPRLLAKDPETGRSLGIPMSAWSMLVSAKHIKQYGWRFVSERDVISEDVFSLLRLYKNVKCVAIIGKGLYYYNLNESSLTKTYRKDRFFENKKFYNRCVKECCDLEYDQRVIDAVAGPFIANVILLLKQEVLHASSRKEAVVSIQSIIDDDDIQEILNRRYKENLKIRILFFLMRHKMYMMCYYLLRVQNIVDERC